jgi:membrane-associated phospholipid phosphatase
MSRVLARATTEALAPAVLAAAMPVIVALVAAPTVEQALGWGAAAALFSAVIPFGVILLGVRRGRYTDHHLGQREQRRLPLLVGVASVAVSLVLFAVLGAPRPLTAMVAVMLAVLATVTVVNHWWKLSGHAAVAAGSATVLTLLLGPALAVTWAAVPLVGWARVRLRDHTPAQVVAGALAGAAVAGAVYTAVV